MNKRPFGFTLLSLLLGCLSIVGINNVFLVNEEIILRILGVAYGASALVAAVALWKLKTWSKNVYLICCATFVGNGLAIQSTYGVHLKIYSYLAFDLLLIIGLSGGACYIDRKLKNINFEQHNPPDPRS